MLLLTAVLEDHMTMFLKLFFSSQKGKRKIKLWVKETKRKEKKTYTIASFCLLEYTFLNSSSHFYCTLLLSTIL